MVERHGDKKMSYQSMRQYEEPLCPDDIRKCKECGKTFMKEKENVFCKECWDKANNNCGI